MWRPRLGRDTRLVATKLYNLYHRLYLLFARMQRSMRHSICRLLLVKFSDMSAMGKVGIVRLCIADPTNIPTSSNHATLSMRSACSALAGRLQTGMHAADTPRPWRITDVYRPYCPMNGRIRAKRSNQRHDETNGFTPARITERRNYMRRPRALRRQPWVHRHRVACHEIVVLYRGKVP